MNRLKFFDHDDPKDRQGFRDILVTQPNGVASVRRPTGGGRDTCWATNITFVHTVADFVNACVEGKAGSADVRGWPQESAVLEAVEHSAKKGRWVKL